jgi:hypothetical protein
MLSQMSPWRGEQYLDTGWVPPAFTLLLCIWVLLNIRRAGTGKDLFIRRIAGLNAIDEAVGRATEMGKPVLMVPGLSDTVNAIVVQALNIFSYVARIAARFSNPILVCCYSAPIYTVGQEVIRDVYNEEGLGDKYDPDSVRFISDRQFAFAAGVSGILLREKAAATFFMGEFYAESLIFAETANSIGAIQIASSTESTQTPFFIAACDYVLIGDEFYAASAYLTRQPVLVGSLVGQDWCKLTVALTVLVGVFANTFQLGPFGHKMITEEKKDAKIVPIEGDPRPITFNDTFMSNLFRKQSDPELKVDRQIDPTFEAPPTDGGGE